MRRFARARAGQGSPVWVGGIAVGDAVVATVKKTSGGSTAPDGGGSASPAPAPVPVHCSTGGRRKLLPGEQDAKAGRGTPFLSVCRCASGNNGRILRCNRSTHSNVVCFDIVTEWFASESLKNSPRSKKASPACRRVSVNFRYCGGARGRTFWSSAIRCSTYYCEYACSAHLCGPATFIPRSSSSTRGNFPTPS